jgi:hypothetical protein
MGSCVATDDRHRQAMACRKSNEAMSYVITTIIKGPMGNDEVEVAKQEFPGLSEEEAVRESAKKLAESIQNDFPDAAVYVSVEVL